jgi:transcriptional regulator with XRE-family HTH domain
VQLNVLFGILVYVPEKYQGHYSVIVDGEVVVAKNPNPVDIHVGGRMRLRRTLLGLSQEKLGNAVGLTFQQIQKYERGANRIGAGRLYQFSRILEVPVSFFYDDMPGETQNANPGLSEGEGAPFDQEQFGRRETLKLVRAYYAIGNPAIRRRIYELTKSVALMDDELADLQDLNDE